MLLSSPINGCETDAEVIYCYYSGNTVYICFLFLFTLALDILTFYFIFLYPQVPLQGFLVFYWSTCYFGVDGSSFIDRFYLWVILLSAVLLVYVRRKSRHQQPHYERLIMYCPHHIT